MEEAWVSHRASQRWRHAGPSQYTYPLEFVLFPSFADWLYDHVQTLRAQNFPIPVEVIRLSCQPLEDANFFDAMWAYGCHFRCDNKNGPTHVTNDSGIACISDSSTNTILDVGILKLVIVVQYAATDICLMKGSWVMANEGGCRTIKKDNMGFWNVKLNARYDPHRHNSYVFPSAISKVCIHPNSCFTSLSYLLSSILW
jgi:hypothetical protein